MVLEGHGGVWEWMMEDGRLVDPAKPAWLGLCLVLGCYHDRAPGSDFCRACRHGNT